MPQENNERQALDGLTLACFWWPISKKQDRNPSAA